MYQLTVFENKDSCNPVTFDGESMVECTRKFMTWLTKLGDKADGVTQRILDNSPVLSLEKTEDGWTVQANPNMAIWPSEEFDDFMKAVTEFRSRLPFEGMWTKVKQESLWSDEPPDGA